MNIFTDDPLEIFIDDQGITRFIWHDALADLCQLGPAKVVRVAHVEPRPGHADWMVDLSPIGGGSYGPYQNRRFALAHEQAIVSSRLAAGMIDSRDNSKGSA